MGRTLPTGTVTFLFSDIEGSTVRWENAPDEMPAALSRHNAILREAIDRHDGVLFETAGDGFVIAFATAPPALAAAVWAQRELRREAWPERIGALSVRMAVHTGAAEMRADGYAAQHTLSRQARLLSAGHGGQILVSSASRELIGDELPESVEFREMGWLWLKDLIEPEEVFQVVASAPPWNLPADFPPLQSHRAPPGNLPTAAVPFIGRERTVDEVVAEVAHGPSRAVTLLGPGGIGKTRLSLRVAERLQHHFVDGVYFVDLAAVTDPALVVTTVASTIGVGDDIDVMGGAAALGRLLKDKEILVVLDNLEQVIDVAPDVAEMLLYAPKLRVLATSRTPLRILEEVEYDVEPLGLVDEAAGHDVSAIEGSESVRLFVERSRASARGFELTDENAHAVAAICRRLEGMPLAIVLAAARSKSLEPTKMLARLEYRLDLLTDGARDLPARHQALRDTIEWSYSLLEEPERALYAQVSVHAGGLRRDAAEAVAKPFMSAEEVTAALDALVDASLIQPVETADGDVRYRMLESIIEHAREKLLASDLGDDTERRHAEHFLGLAERAAPHLEGEHGVEWSARLDEEHDNVRVALARQHRDVEGGDREAMGRAVRLTGAMGVFWLDRGHLSEGAAHLERAANVARRWAEEGGESADADGIRRAAAEIADIRGLIARRRDDLDGARRWLEEAIAGYHELGDALGEGLAVISLGTLSYHDGDVEQARALYNRGLGLSKSSSDRNASAALFSLGNLERDEGNTQIARSLYERSLAIDRVNHDLLGQSVAINNLANLAFDTGDLERARGLHLESIEIRHRLGARMMLAESMVGLASVAAAAGDFDHAARLIGFADVTAEVLGGEFDPMERRLHERVMAALRAGIGEDSLDAARQEGRQMSDACAVDLVRHR